MQIRLSLRAVFWIVLVFAIAAGWWTDRCIPARNHEAVVIGYSDLPDLPVSQIAPNELSLSLSKRLGNRVEFGGYLLPGSMDPPETMQYVLLHELSAIPASGQHRLREYVVVYLRHTGAFTPKFHRLATFEGVFEIRDIARANGATHSVFALSDAVQVSNP